MDESWETVGTSGDRLSAYRNLADWLWVRKRQRISTIPESDLRGLWRDFGGADFVRLGVLDLVYRLAWR